MLRDISSVLVEKSLFPNNRTSNDNVEIAQILYESAGSVAYNIPNLDANVNQAEFEESLSIFEDLENCVDFICSPPPYLNFLRELLQEIDTFLDDIFFCILRKNLYVSGYLLKKRLSKQR